MGRQKDLSRPGLVLGVQLGSKGNIMHGGRIGKSSWKNIDSGERGRDNHLQAGAVIGAGLRNGKAPEARLSA